MLEVAASVNCSRFKMQEPLSNEKIRSITSNAIRYFKQCNFEMLQEEAKGTKYIDVYENAIQLYPFAWEILKKAATGNGSGEDSFAKVYKPDDAEEAEEKPVGLTAKHVVCDGYSLEFDDYLHEVLENTTHGDTEMFYVDSFKVLSRNFEKILHVLQIVLQSGKPFVTCNYYISDGHIERRRKILRAGHCPEDMKYNAQNLKGLPPLLKEILSKNI